MKIRDYETVGNTMKGMLETIKSAQMDLKIHKIERMVEKLKSLREDIDEIEEFYIHASRVGSNHSIEDSWDIDAMAAKIPESKRGLLYFVQDAIHKGMKTHGKEGVPVEDIKTQIIKSHILQERHVKESDIIRNLKMLEEAGVIYFPTEDRVLLTPQR